MSGIASIGIALPGSGFAADTIGSSADVWLAGDAGLRELFSRFVRSAGNECRHFVIPPSEILKLGGLEHRAELFERHAPQLGALACSEALESSGCCPTEIASLIFTSCSVPSIPSVDAVIAERLGLRSSVRRIPMYQQGCAGGMVGLSLASALAEVDGPTMLCSVELCSLVFHRSDVAPAQLVGSAIFGDGAAAALVVPGQGRLSVIGARSELIPGSRHLMGYDLLDDGTHLRLDRELPQTLLGSAPALVHGFLDRHGLSTSGIDFWLVHPGGPKILDALQEAFLLPDHALHYSREVLRTFGNLSSASILFVTRLLCDSGELRRGLKGLLVGVGPGLTIELLLVEAR